MGSKIKSKRRLCCVEIKIDYLLLVIAIYRDIWNKPNNLRIRNVRIVCTNEKNANYWTIFARENRTETSDGSDFDARRDDTKAVIRSIRHACLVSLFEIT